MRSDRAGSGTGEERPSFETRLRALERSGCALLVVGTDADAQHAALCRDLFGDDDAGPRRRVFVATGDGDPAERLPPGARVGVDTAVLALDGATARSAAATTADTTDSPSGTTPTRTVGDGDLCALGTAVLAAVEDLTPRSGAPEPGALRVGLESALPLLEAHAEAATFRFLHLLRATLVERDAMLHVHLPVDRDDYPARLFAPLFDGVVALRVRDGHAQQRWELDDGTVTSRWLSL